MSIARRRVSAVVSAIGLAIVLTAFAALHTQLVSADPAPNARLSATPAQMRLVFSEPIEATLARITIVGASGAAPRVLDVTGDPRDVHAIVAPVDALAEGGYRVLWRVVSADGHPVEGSYVFTVGSADAVPPSDTVAHFGIATVSDGPQRFPLGAATLRGIAVGCLMAACGLLFFVAFGKSGPAVTGVHATELPATELPPAGPRDVRVARWLTLAAPALLAGHALAWANNAAPPQDYGAPSLAPLLATTLGQVELARTGLAILAAWALLLARRPGLAFGFAVGALIVSGFTGHSLAATPLVAGPARSLHLVAAAGWLGGLLWLLLGLTSDPRRAAAGAARVSSIALVAAALVALSGVVQALVFLPSPTDLFDSTYGAFTLAKVAGFAGLIAFGAHHRRRMLPILNDARTIERFPASLRREVLLMALVTLAGGLLAYIPPPGDPALPSTLSSHP